MDALQNILVTQPPKLLYGAVPNGLMLEAAARPDGALLIGGALVVLLLLLVLSVRRQGV